MNVLYEEEGEFKAGSVLSQSPASFQVESPHGRRSKIKAANVVLTFERPSAAELLAQARKYADGLDTDFLWQCRKGAEFGFQELARDYVGRDPGPEEAAGVLFKLHAAPMYFYRRGRGRFQAAPEDTLKLALAGVEKKKRLQEQVAGWVTQLARFECPPEIAAPARGIAVCAGSSQARNQGPGAGLRGGGSFGGAAFRTLRPAAGQPCVPPRALSPRTLSAGGRFSGP